MKFTDGFWHKRAGVAALHPVHLRDIEADGDRLTAYAATRRIHHRGDTLEISRALGLLLFGLQFLDLVFQFLDATDGLLFELPTGFKSV